MFSGTKLVGSKQKRTVHTNYRSSLPLDKRAIRLAFNYCLLFLACQLVAQKTNFTLSELTNSSVSLSLFVLNVTIDTHIVKCRFRLVYAIDVISQVTMSVGWLLLLSS